MRTDPKTVKVGDVMAIVNYVKVKQVGTGGTVLLVDELDHGIDNIKVDGTALVEDMLSADRFLEEKELARTDIVLNIFVKSFNRPMTVNFIKQNGEERTLRCRLVSHEDADGRSMVEDLDETDKTKRIKQVDHRTIRWLIVDSVKYTSKSAGKAKK